MSKMACVEEHLEALRSSPIALAGTLVFVTVLVLAWLGVRYDREQEKKAEKGIRDELPGDKLLFENMPNFRQAGGTPLHNRYGQRVRDGLLFRSSRTDFLNQEEMNRFLQLGIRAIVDLRAGPEYVQADGDKLLDRVYKPRTLNKGKMEDLKYSATTSESSHRGSRYLIHIIPKKMLKNVMNEFNVFIRITAAVFRMVDKFCGTLLFFRLLTHTVGRYITLGKLYMTILEEIKAEVADILRLLLNESNVPVLVHCVGGKDRTGVIVAMILGCLEVEDEVIAADYELSQVRAKGKQMLGINAVFTKVTAETMREMLAEVANRYGSVSGYLSSAGFMVEEQQALKNVFLVY